MSDTRTYTVTGMTCEPLRRLGDRRGPGDPGRRATSTSCSRPGRSPSPAASPSTTPPCARPSKRPATSWHERPRRKVAVFLVGLASCSRRPGHRQRGRTGRRRAGEPRRRARGRRRATSTAAHGGGAETAAEIPGGLMVSEDGYTLRLADDAAAPGRDVPIAFTIEGPDGHPVTEYDVEHEKQLHLIVVRRDFTGFQHVHPELGRRRRLDHRTSTSRPAPGGCSRTSRRPAPTRSPSAPTSRCPATTEPEPPPSRDPHRPGRRLHRHPRRAT